MKTKTITVNDKAQQLLFNMTKMELAGEVGISRPTLDTRLERGNWKKLEAAQIERLYGKHFKEE